MQKYSASIWRRHDKLKINILNMPIHARLYDSRYNQLTIRPCTRELKQLSASAFPLGATRARLRCSEIRARIALYVIISLLFYVDLMKRAQPSRKSVVAIKRTTPSEMLGKWRNVLPNSERVTYSRLPEMDKAKRLLVLTTLLVLLFP